MGLFGFLILNKRAKSFNRSAWSTIFEFLWKSKAGWSRFNSLSSKFSLKTEIFTHFISLNFKDWKMQVSWVSEPSIWIKLDTFNLWNSRKTKLWPLKAWIVQKIQFSFKILTFFFLQFWRPNIKAIFMAYLCIASECFMFNAIYWNTKNFHPFAGT